MMMYCIKEAVISRNINKVSNEWICVNFNGKVFMQRGG